MNPTNTIKCYSAVWKKNLAVSCNIDRIWGNPAEQSELKGKGQIQN